MAPAGHPGEYTRIFSQGLHQGEDRWIDWLGDVVGWARRPPRAVLCVVAHGGRVRPCNEPDRSRDAGLPSDQTLLRQGDDHLVDGWGRRPEERLHLVLGGRPPVKLDVLADEVEVRELRRRRVHTGIEAVALTIVNGQAIPVRLSHMVMQLHCIRSTPQRRTSGQTRPPEPARFP